MRAIFAAGRIAPRRSSLLPCAPQHVLAVTLLSCFIAGAFAAATSSADAARSERADAQSVDRTHKGDRLPLTARVTSATSSQLVTDMRRAPMGCDPAFSRNADPARGHIFGRCLS
jgi:hypothetical protein